VKKSHDMKLSTREAMTGRNVNTRNPRRFGMIKKYATTVSAFMKSRNFFFIWDAP